MCLLIIWEKQPVGLVKVFKTSPDFGLNTQIKDPRKKVETLIDFLLSLPDKPQSTLNTGLVAKKLSSK